MYRFNDVEELKAFIKEYVMTTSEVLEYLGIKRPALNSLIHRGKLKPIKQEKAVTLFFREDIEARKREADQLKKKYRPYDTIDKGEQG